MCAPSGVPEVAFVCRLISACRGARLRRASPEGDLLSVDVGDVQVVGALVTMIGTDSHERTHTVVTVDEVSRRLAVKTVRTN